ncbi:MAG: YraN family protein [Bacteroidota bacterium]
MKSNIEKGHKSEEAATIWLKQKGYFIRHRNWRYIKDEIDIVAENKDYIVFVEVKSRTSLDYGSPADNITEKKMRFNIRAAQAYIDMYEIDKEARFDLMIIVDEPARTEIDHIEDAFRDYMR